MGWGGGVGGWEGYGVADRKLGLLGGNALPLWPLSDGPNTFQGEAFILSILGLPIERGLSERFKCPKKENISM